jgi:hypothetical protein
VRVVKSVNLTSEKSYFRSAPLLVVSFVLKIYLW